jgi:hypothetical protein
MPPSWGHVPRNRGPAIVWPAAVARPISARPAIVRPITVARPIGIGHGISDRHRHRYGIPNGHRHWHRVSDGHRDRHRISDAYRHRHRIPNGHRPRISAGYAAILRRSLFWNGCNTYCDCRCEYHGSPIRAKQHNPLLQSHAIDLIFRYAGCPVQSLKGVRVNAMRAGRLARSRVSRMNGRSRHAPKTDGTSIGTTPSASACDSVTARILGCWLQGCI